jgi:F0F1-type ATP synthase epsilon subunit
MKLFMVSLDDKKSFDIAWLEVNTPTGNFVMQRGHAPMILILSPNKPLIYCLQNGQQESTTIQGGILHITREQATVVLTN